MNDTLKKATKILLNMGLNENLIIDEQVRVSSVLYMIYWIDRLKNNESEQEVVKNNLARYLPINMDYKQLVELSKKYIKDDIIPVQTVDLIIEKTQSENKEVLLFERPKFPRGISLPGGLVEDSDEVNELGIEQKTFAALRIAAEKVLHLELNKRHYRINQVDNEIFYSVENDTGSKKIIIHPKNIYGYAIKENLKSVIRPSDPRHVVDTIGFKCEIIDNDIYDKEYFWESKNNLLNNNIQHTTKNFAFNHHKEIIFHILAKTSVEAETSFNETNFIKSIIDKPLDYYYLFNKRFEKNNFNTNTSFPELFPTVNKILTELFSEDINEICGENKILIGFRDKVVNSLRHVSLKNRQFCPYLPTVNAIFNSMSFFDVVARYKKEFYHDVDPNQILEHNPKEKPNASYHMYKYEYRTNQLLSRVPDEIIIPTFTTLSATELMKVRGVPIRFVGLSKDFLYVDEFDQSPEEFLMHDINHSYRMMIEDEKYLSEHDIPKKQFLINQNDFIKEYMPTIKISSEDDEKTKEIKKIKKIILFEILHEDTRPFLPEIILEQLVKQEGGETKFEMPIIDEKTHYLDVVDILDTEISILSYVRNKLQCGFYDKVDKQNTQIVNPKYRKSAFIAEAAFDMVKEFSKLLNKKITVDYEYILKRVCSPGPDNVYDAVQDDEDLKKYGTDNYLNPKRYKSNQKIA